MTVFSLECQVLHYPWGASRSIPDLLGKPNPDGLPWAELWMGAHPKASSALPGGELLIDYLAARHHELPFLFKILAAASPLSIQCHPDKQQARAGFAREEAAGIPRDAPHRNYRDPNHKPEIIVALEEFWALKGFRDVDEIADLFARAGIALLRDELAGGLECFCRALFGLSSENIAVLLRSLAAGCDQLPADEARWTRELLRLYPGDIGCLAPLFLRLIKLTPGQALYLGAGELHAYLQGTGLELMANSDNVLRGGLTSKHVDTDELLRVLRFTASDAQILAADTDGQYPIGCDEFALTRLVLDGASSRSPSGPEIWLFLGDAAELSWPAGSLSMRRGEVVFCTSDTGSISVQGSGDLWIASAR